MPSAGRTGSDPAMGDAELAAATSGDPAARWRALEACGDYLRPVVRRGRWSLSGRALAKLRESLRPGHDPG